MGGSGKKILPCGGMFWGRHSEAEGFRIQMGSSCSKYRAVTARLETRIPYHATERQVIVMFIASMIIRSTPRAGLSYLPNIGKI